MKLHRHYDGKLTIATVVGIEMERVMGIEPT